MGKRQRAASQASSAARRAGGQGLLAPPRAARRIRQRRQQAEVHVHGLRPSRPPVRPGSQEGSRHGRRGGKRGRTPAQEVQQVPARRAGRCPWTPRSPRRPSSGRRKRGPAGGSSPGTASARRKNPGRSFRCMPPRRTKLAPARAGIMRKCAPARRGAAWSGSRPGPRGAPARPPAAAAARPRGGARARIAQANGTEGPKRRLSSPRPPSTSTGRQASK